MTWGAEEEQEPARLTPLFVTKLTVPKKFANSVDSICREMECNPLNAGYRKEDLVIGTHEQDGSMHVFAIGKLHAANDLYEKLKTKFYDTPFEPSFSPLPEQN